MFREVCLEPRNWGLLDSEGYFQELIVHDTGSVEKSRMDTGGPTLLPNTQPCPWYSLSVWDLPP